MPPELMEMPQAQDVPSLIRGRYVALVGRPDSMSRQEFIELVEANGGKYTLNVGRGVAVVVVGQRDWPVTDRGALPQALRDVRRLIRRDHASVHVLSEQQFLSALGVDSYRRSSERLFTVSTLTELLEVSRDKVRAWVAAGLIRPAKIEYGVWYFDFRQVSAAKRLSELARRGVSLRRLRANLEQLGRWLPEAREPLEQLAVIEKKGDLLVRLEDGDLTAADGQFHFDFTGEHEPPTLKLVAGPRTADDFFEQGIEQENAGYLAEAAESYRQALMIGGPNARTCFNLANTLATLGHRYQALERYYEAVEIDGSLGNAWNNLGILLSALSRAEEACAAYRKAIAIEPADCRAHYNLADALDEMGRASEAAEHWRAYLRYDSTSRWAAYARKRLAAC